MIIMETKIDSYISGLFDWEDYIGLQLGNESFSQYKILRKKEYANNA